MTTPTINHATNEQLLNVVYDLVTAWAISPEEAHAWIHEVIKAAQAADDDRYFKAFGRGLELARIIDKPYTTFINRTLT